MNRNNLREYIKLYKEQFEHINRQEIYKWRAVKQFQDHWDVEAIDFYPMLESSLKRVSNLMDSGQYFPKRMLMNYARTNPEEIRVLFKDLFNEEIDLFGRIKEFMTKMDSINEVNYPGRSSYQDHRATIVYLTLHFPERYYFYKFEMFKAFSERIEYHYSPVRGRIENVSHFQNLCDLIRNELSKDQELLKLHKNRIAEDCYYDESLNILTQDFIYSVVKHLGNLNQSVVRVHQEELVTEHDAAEQETSERDVDFTPGIVNHLQNNAENKRIGDLGEIWVIEREKKKLNEANKHRLANKVKHVAKDLGDGLGYDILSYDIEGKQIFIEVKTTKGNANTPFYITRNELERSKMENESFLLYRLYHFDEENWKSKLQIIKGNLSPLCSTPVNYKVRLANPED